MDPVLFYGFTTFGIVLVSFAVKMRGWKWMDVGYLLCLFFGTGGFETGYDILYIIGWAALATGWYLDSKDSDGPGGIVQRARDWASLKAAQLTPAFQ